MLTGPVLDQSSQTIHLCWTYGDPVSVGAVVRGGAGWAGVYTVESDTPGITAMVPSVVAAGDDAEISLTMTAAASALIPPGVYRWRLKQTGGPTRLSGRVGVKDE